MGDPARYRERAWLAAVVAAWPAGPRPRTVVVVSVQGHRRWSLLDATAPDGVLVFAIGGEHGRPAPALARFRVAQCYAAPAGALRTRLPLGPSGFLPPVAPVPWAERRVPLAFVGWLHPRRAPLYRLLSGRRLPGPLPALLRGHIPLKLDGQVVPGSVLRFGTRFGGGLPAAEWAALLANTRVALVPPGTRQAETFRHAEAARAGCVLVGTGWPGGPPVLPLPRTAAALGELVRDTAALKQHHARVGAWWEQSGRAAAVAARLARWWSAGGG